MECTCYFSIASTAAEFALKISMRPLVNKMTADGMHKSCIYMAMFNLIQPHSTYLKYYWVNWCNKRILGILRKIQDKVEIGVSDELLTQEQKFRTRRYQHIFLIKIVLVYKNLSYAKICIVNLSFS